MDISLPSPTTKLKLSLAGPVATVTVDNPARRNALDLEMWTAFPAIMSALEVDPRVRVAVIRGAGQAAFASGADISEFETKRADASGARRYEAANEEAFRSVAHCLKPTIAMIRGFCLGGGFGLALACDIRIAEEDAVFGIPAARLGVGYPPGAMRMVVAALGPQAAKDLFFTARRIDAREALRLGAVGRVVANDALESATIGLAALIAANAPLTLRAAKAAIDQASGVGADDVDAAALADACFESADYLEGRRAFLEKRSPTFRGE